jgi:hypothetical protein
VRVLELVHFLAFYLNYLTLSRCYLMLNKWDMYVIVFNRLEGAIVASGLKQVINGSSEV